MGIVLLKTSSVQILWQCSLTNRVLKTTQTAGAFHSYRIPPSDISRTVESTAIFHRKS